MHEIQKTAPTHLGRLKAYSPFPMGRGSWRADDSGTQYILDSRFVESTPTSGDIRGYDLPDDDQADFDSGDGSYDIGCE